MGYRRDAGSQMPTQRSHRHSTCCWRASRFMYRSDDAGRGKAAGASDRGVPRRATEYVVVLYNGLSPAGQASSADTKEDFTTPKA